MVLRERIELSTSPLPRECSTTELPQRRKGKGGIRPEAPRPIAQKDQIRKAGNWPGVAARAGQMGGLKFGAAPPDQADGAAKLKRAFRLLALW